MEYDFIEVPAQLIRDLINLTSDDGDNGEVRSILSQLEAILEEQGK